MPPLLYVLPPYSLPAQFGRHGGSTDLTTDLWLVPAETAALCVTSSCAAVYAAPLPAFLIAQFPKRIRFTGIAAGWSLGTMVFGGSAGTIAWWMALAFGQGAVNAYVSFVALISAAAAMLLAGAGSGDEHARAML